MGRQPTSDADRTQEAAALMGRYCDGDARAFHEFYGLVAPRILAYLVGLMGERAAAEDALQVTFLKLHEARSVYVRGADPLPWLYTIAHRTCLDELRKRKRSKVKLSADGVTLPDVPTDIGGATVESAGGEEVSEAAARAMQALGSLPHKQREALLLTTVHGRSHSEAASITGTTAGAIKLRVHRGYETLRRILAGKQQAE